MKYRDFWPHLKHFSKMARAFEKDGKKGRPEATLQNFWAYIRSYAENEIWRSKP